MTWIKRIGLFFILNIIIVLTISTLLNVLGIGRYITARGIDYGGMAVFCLVWGMGGAFISLALSRFMAKKMMGVEVIDPDTRDPQLQALVSTVFELSRAAQLPKMPEVGIYESNEINAFATGPSKSRSLVAVSTGLLNRMDNREVKGVLSHEVAHIANGDMVTMTLLQGVVNAFVMFLARVIAFAVTSSRDSEGEVKANPISFVVQFVLEIVFMIFGSMLVAWFSRYREFRADAGGAALAGSENMIKALEKLQKTAHLEEPSSGAIAAFKISRTPSKFLSLFSTHPPLEDRIARLRGESWVN